VPRQPNSSTQRRAYQPAVIPARYPASMNLRALLLLPLLGLAAAQSPATPAAPTTAPALVETPITPEPATPAPATESVEVPAAVQPARLDDVSATLSAPRTVKGKLPLTLTVKSSRAAAFKLDVPRDNEQNCVTAPTVRVLRVGSRDVVYPIAGASPRLCAQDLRSDAVAARGQVSYTRDLDLPAGDYMVEGWLTGFADGLRVKIPAKPVRVTVR